MGESVADGKALIASAITSKGISTSSTASFSTMSSNIANISTSSGNATAAQVLSGRTFSNASGIGLTGTMTNRGAWTGATTGNGNVTIPAGYHNGNGYISGAGAYNAGVKAGSSGKRVVKTGSFTWTCNPGASGSNTVQHGLGSKPTYYGARGDFKTSVTAVSSTGIIIEFTNPSTIAATTGTVYWIVS